MTTPTNAALRAARKIFRGTEHQLEVAELIDDETRLPALIAAAEAVLFSQFFGYEHRDPGELERQLRAALADTESACPTPPATA